MLEEERRDLGTQPTRERLDDRQLGVGVAMNSRRVRDGYDGHGREVGAVLLLSYGISERGFLRGGNTGEKGGREEEIQQA